MVAIKSTARKDAGRRDALEPPPALAHNDATPRFARDVTAELSLRARCLPRLESSAERRLAVRA